jgi:enterochelin esterase-like enzyme
LRTLPAIASAAVSLAVAAAGQCGPAKLVYEGPAVQLGATSYILHSDKIGRDFQIEVTWPIRPVAPGQKLPAIYALDGGFGVVGAALTPLAAENEVAPAFVVTVGYANPLSPISGAERNTDFGYLRTVDPKDGKSYGGGGAAFEDFLLNEVRPFVEARYPVDPARAVLAGHSGGAYFAAALIARKPDAFSGYVLGGAPMQIDPGMADRIKAAAAKGGGRKVFVFYTPNDVLMGSHPADLSAALTGPGSTFVVKEKIYEGRTHNGSYLMWMADALPFLLPGEPRKPLVWPKPAVVPEKTLDRYLGVYELHPGSTLAVLKANGRLYARIGEGGPFELFPASNTRFIAHAQPMEIDFARGAKFTLRGVELAARKTGSALPAVALFPAPERPVVTVGLPILQTYVGAYKTADGRNVALSLEGGQFYASLQGRKVAVFAYSDTEFFAATTNASLWFEPGGAGRLLNFRLNNGEVFKAQKQ